MKSLVHASEVWRLLLLKTSTHHVGSSSFITVNVDLAHASKEGC